MFALVGAAIVTACGPVALPSTEQLLDEKNNASMTLDGRMIVTIDGATVRTGPDVDSEILARLDHGTIVELEAIVGEIWYKVQDSNSQLEGWILADFLTEIPTTSVTSTTLNVRDGPGINYAKISSLMEDDEVQILGQAYNCGWLKIQTDNNLTGWISSRYTRFAEPCQVIAEPDLPLLPVILDDEGQRGQTDTLGANAALADLLLAPEVIEPLENTSFNDPAGVVLRWSAVKPTLADNEYYLISIDFRHKGQLWTDVAYTKQTSWPLSEHKYLFDLSDNGEFDWSVQLIQEVERNEEGIPAGPALSFSSVQRKLYWRPQSSSNEDQSGSSAPIPPTSTYAPIYPMGLRSVPNSADLLIALSVIGAGLIVGLGLFASESRRRKQHEVSDEFAAL